MLKLRRPLLLSLAVSAVLIPASSAPAATSAQRFADAVERGKVGINAKKGEVKAAFKALDMDRCGRVLQSSATDKLPKREEERFYSFFAAAITQALFVPTTPVLEQILADLNAIPTKDRALRSGRAAWREIVGVLGDLPVIDRPCAQLEAWATSGWKAASRPDFDLAAFETLADDSDDERVERKLQAAARRMRRLGVSRGDAQRFIGETLYDGLDDLVDDAGVFGVEGGDVDSGERSASKTRRG